MFLVPVLLSYSCASLVPLPRQEDLVRVSGDYPGIRLQDLQLGRKIFIANCAGCHFLHPPSELSVAQWEKVLGRMRIKARLDNDATDKVLAYITTYARDATQAGKTLE